MFARWNQKSGQSDSLSPPCSRPPSPAAADSRLIIVISMWSCPSPA